jgi:4-hydroxy-tetrahydrodipicolinate synthase
VAGAGSNSTSLAIELAQRAEAAGADALLSVVPYYNKPMQAGIQAHFRAIAISTALPIILHDVPSRTMRELSDDMLLRLASSRHFIGLKDATGDIPRLLRLRRLLPAGFRLLSGDDTTALPFIANGGDGCISIVSNVAPELCQAVFSNCRLARPQTARYLQDRLVPLTAALTKESPAALKYALFLLGFMSPATRLPIVELTDDAKAEVASAIAEIGDEDIGCPVERWHGPRLHEDSVAQS